MTEHVPVTEHDVRAQVRASRKRARKGLRRLGAEAATAFGRAAAKNAAELGPFPDLSPGPHEMCGGWRAWAADKAAEGLLCARELRAMHKPRAWARLCGMYT